MPTHSEQPTPRTGRLGSTRLVIALSMGTAIVAACTGFVYLLARTGITGEQSDAPDVPRQVGGLRQWTDLPIACGFGISSPRHVAAVVAHADAAIVGSALVRRMGLAASSGLDPVAAAEAFTRELAGGLTSF